MTAMKMWHFVCPATNNMVVKKYYSVFKRLEKDVLKIIFYKFRRTLHKEFLIQ